MKTLIAAFAVPIALLAGAPAIAGAPSIAVGYSDLNMATISGQKTLKRRIASAVKQVCRVGGTRDLASRRQEQRCVEDATRSAQTQLADAGLGVSLAAR